MTDELNVWHGTKLTPNQPRTMDQTKAGFVRDDARWRDIPDDVKVIDGARAFDYQRRKRRERQLIREGKL